MKNVTKTPVAARRTSIMETLEGRQLRSTTPAVVAYLPSWDKDGAVVANLKQNNFRGITHVNYFSVLPSDNGVLPGTTVGDETNASNVTSSWTDLSDLDEVVRLAHAAGVKVNIVLGGAGDDSDALYEIVTGGQEKWDNLADSVGQFAAKHHVDGVDIDWEPDSLNEGEQEAYGNLIATIDQANPTLFMSSAVRAGKLEVYDNKGKRQADQFVLDGNAVQHLDHVMVMAYDLEADNVSRTDLAKTYMNNWAGYVGNSKSKLIFGLPFYGTQGTDWDHTVSQKSYAKLIEQNNSLPAVANDSMTLNGQTWTYNGPTTIYNKTDWAIDNHFGGVGVWAITQDYMTSSGQYDSTHSLLPQITKAVTDNNGSTPAPTEPTVPAAKISATVTSSTLSYRNWQAGKAVDGDLTTYMQGNTAGTASNPEWITLDFGSAKKLTQIKYAARQDARWTMAGGVFQASNNGTFTDAVNLFSVNSTPAAGLLSKTVSGTYRYVRYLAPIGSYGNIAEFQVFGSTPYATSNVRVASNTTSAFSQSDKVITLVESQN